MKKLYYILASKINARISPTVVYGHHIRVDGYTYELVLRAPLGKRLVRKLQSSDTKLRLYA